MRSLNLGCGNDYREGWINIDKSGAVKSEYVIDFEKEKLPFEDNCVDKIEAIDVLEHINDLQNIMNECWRVLKDKGTFYVEVPYAGSFDDYKDPTHVRHFIPETFKYFGEWNLNTAYGFKKWNIDIISSKYANRENQNRICCTLIPQKDV